MGDEFLGFPKGSKVKVIRHCKKNQMDVFFFFFGGGVTL